MRNQFNIETAFNFKRNAKTKQGATVALYIVNPDGSVFFSSQYRTIEEALRCNTGKTCVVNMSQDANKQLTAANMQALLDANGIAEVVDGNKGRKVLIGNINWI